MALAVGVLTLSRGLGDRRICRFVARGRSRSLIADVGGRWRVSPELSLVWPDGDEKRCKTKQTDAFLCYLGSMLVLFFLKIFLTELQPLSLR